MFDFLLKCHEWPKLLERNPAHESNCFKPKVTNDILLRTYCTSRVLSICQSPSYFLFCNCFSIFALNTLTRIVYQKYRKSILKKFPRFFSAGSTVRIWFPGESESAVVVTPFKLSEWITAFYKLLTPLTESFNRSYLKEIEIFKNNWIKRFTELNEFKIIYISLIFRQNMCWIVKIKLKLSKSYSAIQIQFLGFPFSLNIFKNSLTVLEQNSKDIQYSLCL